MVRRPSSSDAWWPVCALADLVKDRGVGALVHGQALALFRTRDDVVHAVGNHDPFARTPAIARGIVGVRAGVPFVASPAHQHAFDLRSGRCLEDPHVSIPVFAVKVVDGVVLVGPRKRLGT